MIQTNFKTTKTHVDIRAYELAQEALAHFQRRDPTAVSTALRRLKGPADRARKKEEKAKTTTPAKDAWDAAHERAEKSYSVYIRTRDTKPFPNGERYGNCGTCSCLLSFKTMQAGHWLSRKHWGTKFHEINAVGQCWPDNDKMRGNGRPEEMERTIVLRFGAEWPDKLRILQKANPLQKTTWELNAIADEFARKTAEILAREAKAA